ncbi:WD40/YVTN/BNR-like repeat-containing protein [Flavicella sediminum]|uniref:WD40/YVTN/BNR-like repeat-containing protein n=1 Tax=Flavicella sediminum TaxID=2585141 RepID=UPI001FB7F4B5|nr:exo-alpha-sialidase [Flavicella sediminum]
MKNLILAILVASTSIATYAQKNNPFFNAIAKHKVQSDPSVEWKNFGPGMSGYNEELWCHPTDENVLFMGPDMHVAYGSWDNGKSWQTIKDSDGFGKDLERVLDIDFSRQNPNFGLALERSGTIYETKDKGRTWSLVHTLPKKKNSYTNVHTQIAIHPTNDAIWFVGAGDFWNVKENHRSKKNIHGKIHRRAQYGYVLKTTDHGKSWKKVADHISKDLDVARIIFNPKQPEKVFIATNYGFFASNDGGENWKASSKGLPNNLPRDLTSYYNPKTKEFILYLVEQTVYEPKGKSITTKGGVYKSTDNGQNWQNITGDLGVNFNKITYSHHRNNYHRALSYFLGENSKALYPKFPENTYSAFNRIVVNPINKDEIYLVANQRHDKSFGPGDAWKTTDGGKTWVICARAGEYWFTKKDKAYWEQKGNPVGANVEFSHVGRAYKEESETRFGNRLLAINSKGDVFIGIGQQTHRSSDKGASWQQIDDIETAPGSNAWIGRGDSDLPGRFMLLETGIKERYLLCSGEHGLWQTAPLGNYPDKDAVAVTQIEGQVHDYGGNHAAHSISTVAVHPNNPDVIYVLSWRQEHRGKLRRTQNGGKTWENISTIFEGKNSPHQGLAMMYSLTIDPTEPNTMYFCSIRKPISEVGKSVKEEVLKKGGYGVYKSTDAGYTWKLYNNGLPQQSSVRRIVMDPKDSNILYACLNKSSGKEPAGLYISKNNAKTWKKMDIPSEIQGVNDIFIDRNTNDMYLSCGYRNGALESGGVWKSSNKGKSWKKFFKAPYVWQTEVSPINSNIITVNVPAQVATKFNQFKNPGIYLTKDAGKTWSKINKGIGQPDKMVDVKPDPYNENIIWSAAWGSGWFKAIIK